MFEFIAGCVVGFVASVIAMTVGMVLERKIRLAINKGDLIGNCISAFVAFRSIEKRKIGFDEDWYEATVEYKKKEGPA